MANRDNETFQFTYSAKEQEELKAIRKKYAAPDEQEDKMAQLRRLDAGVTQKAAEVSIAFGVVGTLILGFGMSLIMTDFPEILGGFDIMTILLGILAGVIGIILVCLSYPVYKRVIKKEREKIAPEILRLTDDLMQ